MLQTGFNFLKNVTKQLVDAIDDEISASESVANNNRTDSHSSYVDRLQEDLFQAVSAEQYKEAEAIKKEVALLAQPSQRAQRSHEQRQTEEMARQYAEVYAMSRRAFSSSITQGEQQSAETGATEAENTEVVRQRQFGDVVQELHLALASSHEDDRLSHAIECAMMLVQMVGDETEEASIEMADACLNKVTATFSSRCKSVAEETRKSGQWSTGLDKSISLYDMSTALGAEDEILDTLRACMLGQIDSESARRVDKIEGAVRLARTVSQGAKLNREDPIFVTSVRDVLNIAAVMLSRLSAVLGPGKMLQDMSRELNNATSARCVMRCF
jgi:hypothetical protein